MRRIRVVILGLGPIGRAVAREVLLSPDLKLAAAVDPAPDLVGQRVADLAGVASAGPRVARSLDFVKAPADVAVHMAASRFAVGAGQIDAALDRGLHIVSTCEEMIAAQGRWPRRAAALDRKARARGKAVVATGVNPGFVMDLLPSALANVCVKVQSVRVVRRVDTSKRRRALQEKTGVGLTLAEFRRRAREGRIGHVGLRDSLMFLARHLPGDFEIGEERLKPVLAKCEVRRGGRRVPAGHVLGVHHVVDATHRRNGRLFARLDLRMEYGLATPFDEIRIAGDPPLHLRFEGGVPGDRATVGAALSGIRWVVNAPPGLVSS
jgi:4-hydroxy-tetrahydrodipicolinate reductase